jgi:site-specific DNA recombinase
MKAKAIGYCRVSTERQASEGVSLSAQERQVKAYCKAKGWSLVGVYRDEGISGKSIARPGLTEALAALDAGQATVLVITKLDRLSRSLLDLLHLVKERFAHNGVSLVSIAESIDATTAAGRFVLVVLAGLAEMERDQLSERITSALQEVRAQGRHLGQVPVGKVLDKESGKLTTDAEEQNAIRRARRMKAGGASWAEVAAAFGWTVSQARTRVDTNYRRMGQRRNRASA